MKTLDVTSFILLIIGGINWGLWGLFQFDLIASIFGSSTNIAARGAYDLIGLAGLYAMFAGWSLKERWHVPEDIDVSDRAA